MGAGIVGTRGAEDVPDIYQAYPLGVIESFVPTRINLNLQLVIPNRLIKFKPISQALPYR